MLHSIVVTLSIVFGGPETTVTLDVNPTFVVNSPVSEWFPRPSESAWFAAVTVPHLIVIDSSMSAGDRERLLREELVHAQQWTALGPWFPVAYGLTLGEPFEPYSPRVFWRTGRHSDPDLNRMWKPTPTLAQRCPLLRINNNGLSILPCWTKGQL